MPTQTLIQGPRARPELDYFWLFSPAGVRTGRRRLPSDPGGASPSAIISDSALLDAPVAYVSFSPGSFPCGKSGHHPKPSDCGFVGHRHRRRRSWIRFQFQPSPETCSPLR